MRGILSARKFSSLVLEKLVYKDCFIIGFRGLENELVLGARNFSIQKVPIKFFIIRVCGCVYIRLIIDINCGFGFDFILCFALLVEFFVLSEVLPILTI